jgi:6,7-dimethyl-8-ribityllumazine synthase
MAIFEGRLQVHTNDRFALVAARFNEFIVDRLVEGAMDCILRHGGSESQVDLFKVPGSFELPQIANRVAQSGKYAGIAMLGAVIRGGTPHFDVIAAEVAKGAAQIALNTGVPLAFGVLTTDTIEQAIERAGTKMGNKGWEAAQTLIELVDLRRATQPKKGK